MVVDDSIVIRGLISRWLNALDDIEVIVACRNGQDAVDQIAKANVDLVVLDIEMPVMDGLTALPLLLKASPGVRVLMASTLTRRNANISMKALALGATDYVPKPEATKSGHASAEFQGELINRIRAIGGKRLALGHVLLHGLVFQHLRRVVLCRWMVLGDIRLTLRRSLPPV